MIAIYERKAPAHGLKHTETSDEEKIFDNEEHEHYQYKLLPGQKHTLSFVLNWNFYFLFVVTLIVVILRSHFYYTAVR